MTRETAFGPMKMILASALCLAALLPALADEARSETLVVGVEYQSIGGALERANDGDTIEVRGGRYSERLRIDKAVHLMGVDGPVISARDGRLMEIASPGVIVEGFTLTYDSSDLASSDTAIYINKEAVGTVIRDNRLVDVMFGIWNVDGSDIRIENNTIAGMSNGLDREYRGNCINLTGSQRAHVLNNTLSYCRDGIYMELSHDARIIGNKIRESRYSIHTMWVDRGVFSENSATGNLVGLAIMYTKHSEINGNFSYGNQTHGILLIQTLRSEVKGNTVIGNTKGIFLYNSIYNSLRDNLVMNNQMGIHNWGGSEDNTISANTLMNNEIQVKFVAGRNQQWDNNYWSDYIGWDMTGDGIGDHPYESNSVVDHILWRYPLAKVLYSSPSLQLLWMLEKQFPLMEVPRVVDSSPTMSPFHADWKQISARYPKTPERFYGELEKLPHMPGGGF